MYDSGSVNPDSTVKTTISQTSSTPVAAGTKQQIVVASTTGMAAGQVLQVVDGVNTEYVQLISVDDSTHVTAFFANNHARQFGGAVAYTLQGTVNTQNVTASADGTGATGVAQDTGGTGTEGWLSSAVKNLRTLAGAIVGTVLSVWGGGTTTVAVPSGAANTVVKGTPGKLCAVVITTIGTTTDCLIYDNATTNSGTVIGVIPGTTTDSTAVKGKVYKIDMPAANGIVAANTASGPAFTVAIQ